jgi:hypothetical protein
LPTARRYSIQQPRPRHPDAATEEDRSTLKKSSRPRLTRSGANIVIDQQLSWAKLSIAAGKPREAADFMFMAHQEYGASQQKIAAAVGKCQAWVGCMIRWCRERFKDDTPFGPASKDARVRAKIKRLTGQRVPRQRKLRRWWR